MVGLEKFCFKRLLQTIDNAVLEEKIKGRVFAQIGNSTYFPKNYEYKRFINFVDLVELIRKSRIVVTHAGVGSTLLCFNFNKIPIIFPRFSSMKEHVDDHQVEFATKLDQEKLVLVSYNPEDLIKKINNYQNEIKEINSLRSSGCVPGLVPYLRSIMDDKR
jgi:UDP-N-acetylglucosamine transferase subunit ALG13